MRGGRYFALLSQGKTIDFVGVDENSARWVQDFSVKPYATPAKLESIDGQTLILFYFIQLSCFFIVKLLTP